MIARMCQDYCSRLAVVSIKFGTMVKSSSKFQLILGIIASIIQTIKLTTKIPGAADWEKAIMMKMGIGINYMRLLF